MLKSIVTEALYGVNSVINSFHGKYPDEQAIFASAATFSELKGQSRIGVARRGVVIFTDERIFFKSVLLSLYSFVYVFGALICFWVFLRTQSIYSAIVGVVVGAMIVQRLPLQKNILLKDIGRANLKSSKGNLFTGDRTVYTLRMVTDDKTILFALDQPLPDEVKQKLGIGGESNSSPQKRLPAFFPGFYTLRKSFTIDRIFYA